MVVPPVAVAGRLPGVAGHTQLLQDALPVGLAVARPALMTISGNLTTSAPIIPMPDPFGDRAEHEPNGIWSNYDCHYGYHCGCHYESS